MSNYTILSIQPREVWKSRSSMNGQPDMQDYAIQFREHNGWVKLTQKMATPIPAVGSVLDGSIGADNRGNPKFTKAQNPAFAGGGTAPGGGKPSYQPKDEEAIKAMFAIKAAIELAKAGDKYADLDLVESNAKALYAMVDRVKGGDPGQTALPDLPPTKNYDNLPTDADLDSPVNLDDIPF